MSTSLNVVNIAQVFWASFSLWAILSLMRFILTYMRKKLKLLDSLNGPHL